MKRFFTRTLNSSFLYILLVVLISIPSFWDSIRPGYFPMHDDLQVMRQLVMDKCFRDFQIPCRWSEDMGYGYGYPIFNYYPPLPYYVGHIFRILGIAYIDIAKIIFSISLVISGVGMYILAKEFWGKLGGLIAAVFYIYAPYHAVDIYVRGAMNESWALSFFPLIFWSIYKVCYSKDWKFVPISAIFTTFLMLSHNLMLLIFAPMAVTWGLYWLVISKNYRNFLKLLVVAIWGLGLAAFFTIPVVFEQSYVHVETLTIGYFNYLAHFVGLEQLFLSSFWGYGGSFLGTNDGMSYQVGYLHSGLGLLSLVAAAISYKRNKKISFMIIGVFLSTLFALFMVHPRSVFIWEVLPPVQFLQFPWRFLSVVIFGVSFLAGSVSIVLRYLTFNRVFVFTFGMIIILGVFLMNRDYFRWEKHWEFMTDKEKLSGELWKLQITAGIYDYLPKFAPRPPGGPPIADAEIVTGKGRIEVEKKNSTYQSYKIIMDEGGEVMVNTYYFPGWEYSLNGVILREYKLDEELGRPILKLPKGESKISIQLNKTFIRSISDWASLLSLATLFLVAFKYFAGKYYKYVERFR